MALSTLWRHTLRTLGRRPGFTITAVASLAVGLAAAATTLLLARALLLSSLPGVARAHELATVEVVDREGVALGGLSFPAYQALEEGAAGFASVVAFSDQLLSFRTEGDAEAVLGQAVSANYFSVLGVKPALGRLLAASDFDLSDPQPVAVLSHALWRQRFGSDPALIGKQVTLNGVAFTVVGVAADGFRGLFRGFRFEVWTPLSMASVVEPSESLVDPARRWLEVVARSAPGTGREQLAAGFATLAPRITELMSAERRGDGLAVGPVTGLVVGLEGAVAGLVAVLFAVALLVHSTAVANVASLVLTQTVARVRELAVRQAVGASRAQLSALVLAEGVVLGLSSALVALLLAAWMVEALRLFEPPPPLALDLNLTLEPVVIFATLAAGLATGLAVGAGSIFEASRSRLGLALRELATAGRRRVLLARVFIAGQVAFSLLLLTGAGLFVRSLERAATVELGFEPAAVEVALLDLSFLKLSEEELAHRAESLAQAAEGMAGARLTSLADRVPLGLGRPRTVPIAVAGHEPPVGQESLRVASTAVGPRYFELLHLPLLNGREFSALDRADGAAVAIVNATLADRFWGRDGALGQTFEVEGTRVSIVGVVGDSKVQSLTEEPAPMLYRPFAQASSSRILLLVRGASANAVAAAELRRVVRGWDADVPVTLAAPLERIIALSLLPQRIAGAAAGILGAVALLLSALGVYGSVAQAVERRRREFGIRLALGAEQGRVIRSVVGESLRVALVGVAAGAVAALALLRLAKSLLFGVAPSDPLTHALAIVLLVAVSAAASYLPARRVAACEPLLALRSDS